MVVATLNTADGGDNLTADGGDNLTAEMRLKWSLESNQMTVTKFCSVLIPLANTEAENLIC